MYTIVVADDEAELRQAIIRRVNWEEIGFTVVAEAENGAEALECVERLEPDLLLTDIRMPFISGIELARQVREIRPSTQIAFLSGHDDFTYAQQAIQYNIISYMLKPISAQELTDELKKIKEKIDEKFRTFVDGEKGNVDSRVMPFLYPLILDEYQEEEEDSRNEELLQQAVECGMLSGMNNAFQYTIMVTNILNSEGKNVTKEANVSSIDSILKKYLKSISFYTNGRVVSLLMATKSSFEKYLHIATEEIAQSVNRIMEMECLIGVGRVENGLSSVHKCYVEAMKALNYAKDSSVGTYFISEADKRKNSAMVIVEQAVELIEKQYQNAEISLSSVSNEIGVSPNYLSTSIKKVTGSTFIDLLSTKRIELAKELLQHSNKKIREIAEECGYSDQHYFSYCFKKYTGMSPNACRKN